MLINVYDFDNTIYRGDSSFDFFCHCARRLPRVLLCAAGALPWLLMMLLGMAEKTRVKERFYRYLRQVPDVKQEVDRFWRTHEKNVKAWYLDQKRAGDLIISASPEFLLHPVMERLELSFIASRVDPETGRYDGLNCHGKEKVRRLRESRPEVEIDRFYSDSCHDAPLAGIAREAFMVKGDRIGPFPFGRCEKRGE